MAGAVAAEHGGTGRGPIGGQALLEGVMMRRDGAWGAAARRADGSITTTCRRLPDRARWRRMPLVRGVLALGESVGLGTKAMVWAAAERGDDDPSGAGSGSGYSTVGLVVSTVVAAALAVGMFGILPAALTKALGVDGPVGFNLVEGALRLGVLLGYLCLLSLSSEVRRVFGYHGAEHMTIHAYEHGVALEPAAIRAFDRRHPRCGTSFLLLVVAVAVLAHVAVGTPSWPVLVTSRVLLLPVVAGLSYEAIRFAGRHQRTWAGRVLTAPGSWLQTLTTREPDDDQIEVAVAALEATLASEAQVRPPVGQPAPLVEGARA